MTNQLGKKGCKVGQEAGDGASDQKLLNQATREIIVFDEMSRVGIPIRGSEVSV